MDSPLPLRLPEKGLSQPLSACTDSSYTDGQVVQYTADIAERGWESAFHGRRRGAAVHSKSDIYSLMLTFYYNVFTSVLFFKPCIFLVGPLTSFNFPLHRTVSLMKIIEV